MSNPVEPEQRKQLRKIIRSYYSTTFEYAMEQLKKGLLEDYELPMEFGEEPRWR